MIPDCVGNNIKGAKKIISQIDMHNAKYINKIELPRFDQISSYLHYRKEKQFGSTNGDMRGCEFVPQCKHHDWYHEQCLTKEQKKYKGPGKKAKKSWICPGCLL